MLEINRYTFLNLDTRPDRRLLAECTAWRDGIPDEMVHFWTGESWFKTWDNIGLEMKRTSITRLKLP